MHPLCDLPLNIATLRLRNVNSSLLIKMTSKPFNLKMAFDLKSFTLARISSLLLSQHTKRSSVFLFLMDLGTSEESCRTDADLTRPLTSSLSGRYGVYE